MKSMRLLLLVFCVSLSGCSTLKRQLSHDVISCRVEPGFTDLVYKAVGRERANESTSYGLAVYRKSTGETLCESYVQRDRNVYPASSIKPLVALAALRLVDAGKLRLSDLVAIDQSNANAECKYWDCAIYGQGKELTVLQLLNDMLVVSNNIATNQLIQIVTRNYINETAHALGADSLKIVRKLYQDVNPEPWITQRNSASAHGLVQLYREIATGRLALLRPESRFLLEDMLRHEKFHGYLNGGFPPEAEFFHKNGSTSDSASDGGYLLMGNDTVVVLVGIQGFPDGTPLKVVGRGALDQVATSSAEP